MINTDVHGTLTTVCSSTVSRKTKGVGGVASLGYEFYFLPGTTAEECVTHYRRELDARGTIWRQIHKVKTALRKKNKQEEDEEGADDSVRGSSSSEESQDDTAGERLSCLVRPKRE